MPGNEFYCGAYTSAATAAFGESRGNCTIWGIYSIISHQWICNIRHIYCIDLFPLYQLNTQGYNDLPTSLITHAFSLLQFQRVNCLGTRNPEPRS